MNETSSDSDKVTEESRAVIEAEMTEETEAPDQAVEDLTDLLTKLSVALVMKSWEDIRELMQELSVFTLIDNNQPHECLNVVILHLNASIPKSAHSDDAGYDMTTPNTITLKARTVMQVPLGIAVEAPTGSFIKIEGHSSLVVKGVMPINVNDLVCAMHIPSNRLTDHAPALIGTQL
ncbi:hypothetical protein LPJ59_000300 [Coemansia sp. RSA 2399]|nr:hypothetical protein LPJ59_000300 [Coemansia sp. RSA 2399]